MNGPVKAYSVNECKIQASILLKSLYSQDLKISQKAAKRFQRLPEFQSVSHQELNQTKIKRKYSLAVIALENGFESWRDLKCQLPFIKGGYLNHWFSNYEKAKNFQNSEGGYLLPFKNQFFICDKNYIDNLELRSNDPDWALIGFDWYRPNDKAAWQRLYKKWMAIQKEAKTL